ncbi:hypothetical protein Fmac_010768 [Flemingia macrophylla]|uniref:NAC domain-containing protein n=1 Tax=Flemingia macrophylla TaxID=520843 RepID=A0ABD1MKI5_9FABA
MEHIVSMLGHIPVGYRFRPTDEELVNYYLRHKLLNDDFPVHIIPVIDLCKVEPWDVRARSVIKSDDPEWFFFSPLDYKYQHSKRVNRTTERGYWKSTGRDRTIKKAGSKNVIGTKKTLVFHVGRVPGGSNSNWVIHEYHDKTFPECQRTFVLCRLMKKADKKTKGENETPRINEGEPSRLVVSDHENPETEEEIPFVDTFSGSDIEAIFQALQESPTGQESFISNFRNDNQMQSPLEATDDEIQFVNSLLAADVVTNEESRHHFLNSSTQPKSLKMVYNEIGSSNTNAKVVSNLHDNVHFGEYTTSEIFESSYDAVRGGTSRIASNHEAKIQKAQSISQDDFGAVETSSCDSNTDNFMLQKNVTRRIRKQMKTSKNAVSQVEALKKLGTVRSEKNVKIVPNQSSDVNKNGSFIYMEPISPNQSLFPRSVCLVNVVIGILLLIVISWEVSSY